jgi:hypothetical protein
MPGTSVGPFHIALQQGLNHVLKGVPFVLMLLYKLCTSSAPSSAIAPSKMDTAQQTNLQVHRFLIYEYGVSRALHSADVEGADNDRVFPRCDRLAWPRIEVRWLSAVHCRRRAGHLTGADQPAPSTERILRMPSGSCCRTRASPSSPRC